MIKKTQVFWKTIDLLSHPFTLFAIALLFLNDWILRVYWPSWWTGKIGDFAWLFFFPLVLAVPLSILPSTDIRNHERIIKTTSISLTGMIFILAKTIPIANQYLNRILELIFGFRTNIRTDPTDLIALISLVLICFFWDTKTSNQIKQKYPGWVWLQAAIILTIANSPAEDYGIEYIGKIDNQIVAHSSYEKFVSYDGGIAWDSEISQPTHGEFDSIVNSQTLFDYIPGEIIKISKDGGESYPIEYSLVPAEQPLRLKYEERRGSPVFKPGPLDAVFDPESGNSLFAMGHEGILIFTDNGEWQWISVGGYQRITYDPSSEFFELLFGEFLMSLFFGLLIINTFTFRTHKGWIRKVIFVIGWIVFFFNLTVFPPAVFNSHPQSYYPVQRLFFYIIQLFWILFYLFPGIIDIVRLFYINKRAAQKIILLSVTGTIVFITPFLFWSFNILPLYSTASILASVVGIIMIISVYFSMISTIDDYSTALHGVRFRDLDDMAT